MRFVTLAEVLELYQRVVEATGGSLGIRDLHGLESALAQPRMTFEGDDLYPSMVEKAAALAFSLIKNHPFVDGNKRLGHAAMELFLLMNGFEISAPTDEQERLILRVASGDAGREELVGWLERHVIERKRMRDG
jgi:death-on-curing protein